MCKQIKAISFLLVVMMIINFTACSKNNSQSSDYDSSSDAQYGDATVSSTQDDGSKVSSISNFVSSSSTQSNSTKKKDKTCKEVLSSMPKALKGSTLKIASWNEVEQVKGAKEVIAKFEKITGVNVKWQVINYGEYTTKITAMIAAKQSPDIVRLSDLDPSALSVLQPINVSKYNFNDGAWSEFVKNYYTVNGKSYAVSLENSLFYQPSCVFYNRDLISKYNLEDPYQLWKSGDWTFDKFISICRDFRDQTDDTFTPWSTKGLYDYASFNNTDFTKFDGTKFVNNLNDPTLLTAWQQTLKWIEEGVTKSSFWDHDGFNSGKVLFHTSGFIAARTTQAYFTTLKADGNLGVAPIPQIRGQKYYVDFHEIEAYGIAKGANNPSTVPYFLRYYLDESNYNEKVFFTDERALDVYKWLLKQGNYCKESHTAVITKDAGYDKDLVTALKLSKAEQVATILQSYNSVVDRAVEQTNTKLSKLQ